MIAWRALVTQPGHAATGKLVRVVGKFRGKNLYGDLPARRARERGDWVIKDDAFAVWVTGKKPKGKGFELDASLKRDTDKWIEVVGRPDDAQRRHLHRGRAGHAQRAAHAHRRRPRRRRRRPSGRRCRR